MRLRTLRTSHRLLLCASFCLGLPLLTAGARDVLPSPEHPEYEFYTRRSVSTRGLVAAWRGDGDARDRTGHCPGTPHGGVSYVPAMVGRGFYFDGAEGGVNVEDSEPLRITGSVTISAWVYVESYPSPQQEASMILFRGDDRSGLDPYFLQIDAARRVRFAVEHGADAAADVSAPIPAGRFVLVTGTLDAGTGQMRLYENGKVAAETTTTCTPMHDLDPSAHPGVGIGYAQSYPQSGFHYPFHGVINELLLYKRALSPAEVRALYEDRTTAPALSPEPTAAP